MTTIYEYAIFKHNKDGGLWLIGFSEVGGVWQKDFDNHVFLHNNRDYVRGLVVEYDLGNTIEIKGRIKQKPFITKETVNTTSDPIKALAKINQSDVKAAYKYLRKYHELVNAEDFIDDENERAKEKNQDKQAVAYTNYLEHFENLPKGEQANFNRQHKQIHGYV
jgi:hypothetical protein